MATMDYENENGRFEGMYESKVKWHNVSCGICTMFDTNAKYRSLE